MAQSADDAVHACYVPGNGQLRVIGPFATCRPNEVEVALAVASALECRPGTTRFVGVCIENGARTPEDHGEATETCAAVGGRLPSGGELQGFREVPGILLATDGEWTDDLGDVTVFSPFAYLAVTQTGNGVVAATEDFAFRCVFGPGNG
jgi:hypothetical protein